MKNFIKNLFDGLYECFTGYYLLWQIFAISITYFLVTTNFDWYYFVHTRSQIFYIFFPAVIIGGLIPILLPLYFIIRGYFAKNKYTESLGWILAQAAISGSIISSFYKFFTGRLQPNLADITHNISQSFNFGIFRHGIFWGWPSSHTTIAFAMAFTLIYLFQKNKLIKYTSFIYALYVGVGVSLSIHWFSDFVAGAIIGTVIGIVVEKNNTLQNNS